MMIKGGANVGCLDLLLGLLNEVRKNITDKTEIQLLFKSHDSFGRLLEAVDLVLRIRRRLFSSKYRYID
jgi:hypothetical protein